MILAYQYAEINSQKGFSKMTKKAGHWWLKDFLNLSVNRAMCANAPTIDKFFNIYNHFLQDVPKEENVIGITSEKVHTMSPKE